MEESLIKKKDKELSPVCSEPRKFYVHVQTTLEVQLREKEKSNETKRNNKLRKKAIPIPTWNPHDFGKPEKFGMNCRIMQDL